ncbi:uncharacterized protein ISCGN_013038 [Ixodes scapularis]
MTRVGHVTLLRVEDVGRRRSVLLRRSDGERPGGNLRWGDGGRRDGDLRWDDGGRHGGDLFRDDGGRRCGDFRFDIGSHRPTVKITQLARGYGAHSLQQPPITWLLLLAGDVLPNPGPGLQPICPRCHRPVLESAAALQCDGCDLWLHRKSELLSLPAYRLLAAYPAKWYCGVCASPAFDDDLFSPPASQYTGPAPVVSASPTPVSIAREGSSPPFPTRLTPWATVASLLRSSVILLSEPWLDTGVQDSEVFDSTYAVFRKYRSRKGGGVLIATPSSISVNRRDDLESPDLEAVFAEVFLPRGPILLACVYCPPNRREVSYTLLDASFSRVRFETYRDVILLGDFNSHIERWSHEEPSPSDNTDDVLLDVISDAGLQQAPLRPRNNLRGSRVPRVTLGAHSHPSRFRHDLRLTGSLVPVVLFRMGSEAVVPIPRRRPALLRSNRVHLLLHQRQKTEARMWEGPGLVRRSLLRRGLAVAGNSWLRPPTRSELANLRPRFRMQWELLTLPTPPVLPRIRRT